MEGGLILKHRAYKRSIFLVHGHQGDLINDKWWKLGRFLVRYLWGPLEQFGGNDPTGAAKNEKKRNETERRLMSWVEQND